MGLFSRLTASIRARSRQWRSGNTGAQDYPEKSLESLWSEALKIIADHESLKSEMLAEADRLGHCLRRQDVLAVEAVRLKQDKIAAGALYCKLLVSRQTDRLHSKIDGMSDEQARLEKLLSRLKLKIQSFHEERKKIQRGPSSEDASARIGEAVAGLGEELTAMRYALDRVKAKAAEARISYETARRLAAQCAGPAEVEIPDRDREPVARALQRLKAEMKLYDRPHPQR